MNIRSNVNLILSALIAGHEIKANQGNTLVWSEEHQAPAIKVFENTELDAILVDDNATWLILIRHAQSLKEEDAIALAGGLAISEYRRKS